MKLIPRISAGRTNRRARAFCDEIARLRCEGYGYVAIKNALADAGVVVSKSTVQREVARLQKEESRYPSSESPSPQNAWTAPEPSGPTNLTASGLRSGSLLTPKDSPRAIAEAFVKGPITNPLFKDRS